MKHIEIIAKKKLFKIFLIILILFMGMLTINEFKKGKYIGQESQNTISFSGTGEVFASPDLVLTTFSVVTEGKTTAEALSENGEKMNAVIDFLKVQGVEDKDLKTTSFNIYPRYEWQKTEIPPYPEGRRVLVGYEVSQSLEVKIRDMKKIGTFIEGATNAGANRVSDLQFTFDNEDEFKAQARKQAIDKAKAKASELAKQLGIKLGRITNFQESFVSPIFYDTKEAYGLGSATPQIETGENAIKSSVIITYEIH